MGLDNAPFFHDLTERQNARTETRSEFRTAGHEMTDRALSSEAVHGEQQETNNSDAPTNEFVPAVRNMVAASFGSFLDVLVCNLLYEGSAPKTNERYAGERDKFAVAAEEATKQAQHQEREMVDAEWNSRQKGIRGE
jgi:hypothetical protein